MSKDDDTGERSTPAQLRARAWRYREMARTISDPRTIEALLSLADKYEAMAERMEQG
jgi:hypothetical protein